MMSSLDSSHTQPGNLAQLIGEKGAVFIISLDSNATFQSHLGYIHHKDIIGLEWGITVHTHLGKSFQVLQPSLDDILRTLNRNTQIIYPKDLGYILLSLNIGPGRRVLEAGTGSGALTIALATLVGNSGHIYSYDNRAEHQNLARQNLAQLGLQERVTFHLSDIADGFVESDVNALFLDLQNPHDFVAQSRAALMPGGFFGALLPTTNQVSELITALKKHNFGFIEVSEILHRYYKPTATRLRPADKMVAHTGFLVFARRIAAINPHESSE